MTSDAAGPQPDRTAADPDVGMIEAAYAAYARGDIGQVVARLHPQVEWIEPEEFPGGGRRTGPAAVAEYLTASLAGWAELHSSATVYRQGDTIVARHHVQGRLASGAAHEITVADVFTVRDGLVVRMQAYADPADAERAHRAHQRDAREREASARAVSARAVSARAASTTARLLPGPETAPEGTMAWQQLADLPFARALTAHTAGLVTAETYDCAHFDGEVLEDQDGSASSFLECAFTQMTLQRCRLTRARFTDVWLSDAQLIAVSAPHTSWQDVTFTGTVLAGVEVYAAQLRRVTFDRCKLDSVNFRDADLADVTFDNCVLRNIDLGGARVKRTAFPASRLAATKLVQTTLDQVDLREAAELGLTVDPASLRGAIVTTAQLIDMAPVLAESIGITVEDQ